MSLTTTLTDRAADILDNRSSRRGFLTRTAMAGSAVAAAGVTYATRPTSAYAAVCGCNGRTCNCTDLCCDGYTEFCCQIYGSNSCPPNTILAGWWKVDNSDFCAGAARYYMDCNKTSPGCGCGSSGVCRDGTACQCRSCGNRKDGCTVFRYGNCNNDVSCVGPIMCRVVTCSKPWEIDPGCSTVSRTDANTRHHHRPCLISPTRQQEAFIHALYRDYLSRTPDGTGFRYWTEKLVALEGHPLDGRDVVSWSFAYSTEYMTKVVTGWYRLGLDRNPDSGGLAYWVNQMQSGVKPSQIAGYIFSGPEFYSRAGGTDRGFVQRLHNKILGRAATAREESDWVGRLAAGESRTTVSYAVFQSIESRRKRVTVLYQRFLRRNPDQTGLDYWTDVIRLHEDVALSVYIGAGEEYLSRAIADFP